MLEKSLGLLFYQKKVKNYKKGPVDIYLRITVDGLSKDISTKRKFDLSRWNPTSGRAVGNKEDDKTLNAFLDTLLSKVYEARRQMVDAGEIVTAAALKDFLAGASRRDRTILKLLKEHNDNMQKLIGKGFSENTHGMYVVAYNHIAQFIKWKYKVPDLNILMLDLEFVTSLDMWFKTEKGDSHNTSIKNITCLKKVVLHCVKHGWLPRDPFALFPMIEEEVEPVFLSREELQAIIAKSFHIERIAQVRDVFVFCCCTGLAFIDVKNLRKSEVSIGIDGNMWIQKHRQKTKAPTPIPLLPISLQILKKYEKNPACIQKDVLLPVLSNQKYNSYLKEIADLCGITKNLTTHVARHTFGTTVTMLNGVPIESIQKMMGHKNVGQTQHYSRVLPIKISEDMKVLEKRLKKNNFLLPSPPNE